MCHVHIIWHVVFDVAVRTELLLSKVSSIGVLNVAFLQNGALFVTTLVKPYVKCTHN